MAIAPDVPPSANHALPHDIRHICVLFVCSYAVAVFTICSFAVRYVVISYVPHLKRGGKNQKVEQILNERQVLPWQRTQQRPGKRNLLNTHAQ